MLLSELLRDVEYTGKIEDIEIKDVTGDSRRVEPGSVFVCIKGGNIDGHEYAAAAKRNGAAWIVADIYNDGSPLRHGLYAGGGCAGGEGHHPWCFHQ